MRNKVLDVLFFVIGPVLLAFGLFDFSSSHRGGGRREPTTYAVYYYSEDVILLIAVGVGLIAFGLLWRSWRNGR